METEFVGAPVPPLSELEMCVAEMQSVKIYQFWLNGLTYG